MNSKMFNQVYDDIKDSKTVYTMKTADMTNKQDAGEEFNPSTNTITINKDNVSYMTIAEEVYHAYQSENKQGSAENQEYEAKSAATIMEIEARQGISTNMFENSFFNNITIGVYNSNKNTINPNHPSLNNDYIKGGTEFVNYNKAINPKEVKYLRPVTQIPSVFMDLIKKVYK